VNGLIKEVIAADVASKRKAGEAGDGEPVSKKEKKEKKDKKHKHDDKKEDRKDGKTDDQRGDKKDDKKDGRKERREKKAAKAEVGEHKVKLEQLEVGPEPQEAKPDPQDEPGGAASVPQPKEARTDSPPAAAEASADVLVASVQAPEAAKAEDDVNVEEEGPDEMFADFTEEAVSDMMAAAAADPNQLQSTAWALSGGEDGTLRLWSLDDFTCPRVVEAHEGGVHALVVDWAEMLVLSGGADGCKLWELRRGACQRNLPKAKEGCLSLAASRLRQGQALGGCADGSLQLWDLATGEATSSVAAAHPGGVWALDVAWERRRATSGGDASFKVWDTDTWECLHTVEGHPGTIMALCVDWERSSVLVAAGLCGQDPRALRLWDWTSQTAEPLSGCEDAPASIAVDWNRGVAVTGGWDAQLRTWSVERRLCTRAQRCAFGRVRSMAVDFGSERALCGSSSGTLHLMDLQQESSARVLEGHVGGVTALCASF